MLTNAPLNGMLFLEVISMPRAARKLSQTGIYHIMLRGANGQQIFKDSADYAKFLRVLSDCKDICKFQLYAYCLMGNHIHILLKQGKEPLEQIFKRIGSRFVYWYNIKYQRSGHLFQDRFRSEPVETDEYFLTALRYIHQNPVKAGISRRVEDYRYSSFGEYLHGSELVDTAFGFDLLPSGEFLKFHQEDTADQCLDITDAPTVRLTDEDAQKIIYKHTRCSTIDEFQELSPEARDKALTALTEEGLSIRQISRLTGVSFGVARRFQQTPKEEPEARQHREPSPVFLL